MNGELNASGIDYREYVIQCRTLKEIATVFTILKQMGYEITFTTNEWEDYPYIAYSDIFYRFLAFNKTSYICTSKEAISFDEFIALTNGKKLIKKNNKDIDPLEEEDWGYTIKESLDGLPSEFCVKVSSEEEYLNLMIFFEKNNVLWNGGDKATVSTPFRHYPHYIFFNTQGNKSLTQGAENHDLYLQEIPINDLIFDSKKFIKNINPDIDPLGEEDWGYTIKESLKNVPDNFCVRVSSRDEYLNLMNFFEMNNIRWNNGLKATAVREPGYGFPYYIFFDSNYNKRLTRGKDNNNNTQELSVDELIYLSEIEDIPVGKKIVKNRNIENDPFDEEDWGYTLQESIFNDLPKNFYVKTENKEDFIRLMQFFEYNNVNWLSGKKATAKGFNDLYRYIIYKPSFIKDVENVIVMSNSAPNYSVEIPINDLISNSKKYIKNRNIENDPFDEEDWGYTLQESHFLQSAYNNLHWINDKFVVKVPNLYEYMTLMNFFRNIDIRWSSHSIATNGTDHRLFKYPFYILYEDRAISLRSGIDDKDCKIRTIEELNGEKIKKNINPDIDPFDEEDWGYTLQESKKDFDESKLKESAFLYDTIEECRDIARFFSYLGFGVYSYDKVMNTDHANKWRCWIYINSNDGYYLMLASEDYLRNNPDTIRVSYSDFLKFKTVDKVFNESELKRLAFLYDTVEECRDIARFFSLQGYKIYSHDEVMKTNLGNRWKCWAYIKTMDGYYLALANEQHLINHPDTLQVSYSEFLKFKSVKKISKNTNLEIDPFEEEDWGFSIQENKSLPDFRKYAISFQSDLEAQIIEEALKNMGFRVSSSTYANFHCFAYYAEDDVFYACQWGSVVHSGKEEMSFNDFMSLIGGKNLKFVKNTNIEVDPFDEEDWGYSIQESSNTEFVVGDFVLITDKLNYYIKKERWSNKISELIGRHYKIIFIFNGKYYLNCPENFYVFDDCMQKIGEPKKNLEIDPFEEEDWDTMPMQESLFGIFKKESDNELIKKVIETHHIIYKNNKECQEIAKKLKNMGYDVYNYKKIMSSDDIEFKAFVSTSSSRFSRTDSIREPIISYENFITLISNKKVISIKNNDIDPFEEEDWGYQVDTSELIKKIEFNEKI